MSNLRTLFYYRGQPTVRKKWTQNEQHNFYKLQGVPKNMGIY